MGSSPDRVKPRTLKLVFVASPLRRNSKDGLARNQDNVSEWGCLSTNSDQHEQAKIYLIYSAFQSYDLERT